MRAFMDVRASPMVNNHQAFQQLGQQNVETTFKMFGEWSNGWRTIGAEMSDFTKRSLEDAIATFEKLLRAKSLEQAVGIQSDFTTRAFDGYFHSLSKIGGMYAQLLKDSYQPLERVLQSTAQPK
jgi:hypothetical protein